MVALYRVHGVICMGVSIQYASSRSRSKGKRVIMAKTVPKIGSSKLSQSQLKQMAMGFARGRGMAVVALMQISRKGFMAASESRKKTGIARFNLTHLSYANEAERSGDRITTSWIDEELASQNRVLYQCLKARDDEPFKIFYVRIEWPCMRMYTTHDRPVSQEEREAQAKEIDKDQENLDVLLD